MPVNLSQWFWRSGGVLLVLLIVLYAVDSAWFFARVRVSSLGQATGSVHRTRLLAIPDKGNKTEFQIDAVQPEEDLPCAHSLFPHNGAGPCWYVVKHAKDPIPM